MSEIYFTKNFTHFKTFTQVGLIFLEVNFNCYLNNFTVRYMYFYSGITMRYFKMRLMIKRSSCIKIQTSFIKTSSVCVLQHRQVWSQLHLIPFYLHRCFYSSDSPTHHPALLLAQTPCWDGENHQVTNISYNKRKHLLGFIKLFI